jgi:hypothetical protein
MVFGPVNPRGGLLSAVLHLQEQGGWSKTGVFFELQSAVYVVGAAWTASNAAAFQVQGASTLLGNGVRILHGQEV